VDVKFDSLENLALDTYLNQLKYSMRDGKKTIFDPVRKHYYIFTPEELTRQLILQHFLQVLAWPKNLISVEKAFGLYGQQRRYDIVFYKNASTPAILVECKAPSINLTNRTFEQVANYNIALQIPFMLVSNCRDNYLFSLNFESKSYKALKTIDLYKDF